MVMQYEIFAGRIGHQPRWLEAAVGLEAAFLRMTQLSRDLPGSYFIFSVKTQKVLAAIDSSASFASLPLRHDLRQRGPERERHAQPVQKVVAPSSGLQ